jgi:hypothetical protein
MEWKSDGRLRSATFDDVLPTAESARRLRTALDADGDWMREVLRDADARLTDVREQHPEAGGLVLASDQDHARAIAAQLAAIAGEAPEIVMSDEPAASARLADFSASRRRWLVSVLMVSEGVDIPRLRVGVYATAARTELFFRQVVGRFIRRTPAPARQMSYLLIPADARLKRLAVEIEEERRHALELMGAAPEEPVELDAVPRRDGPGFEALSSSVAQLDEAILAHTTMQLFATEHDPAPTPAQVRAVRSEPAPETAFAARERLRAERARLVRLVAGRTGEQHRVIHGRINRATGARSVGAATLHELERGNELLLRELRR